MSDSYELDAGRVEEVFVDCLFRDGEPVDEAVVVEGVTGNYGLHPGRLGAHANEIRRMLDCLPLEFHVSGGGGWSFLNACNDRDGRLWTGMHRTVENLLCLGLAIGCATILLPRDLWSALPGGVPYFSVDTSLVAPRQGS